MGRFVVYIHCIFKESGNKILKKKRRKTLSQRIRYTTKLCIVLAILFFASTLSFVSAYVTKENTSFFAGVFAHFIADRLSSQESMEALQVSKLNEIRVGTLSQENLRKLMADYEKRPFQYFLTEPTSGQIISLPENGNPSMLHEAFIKLGNSGQLEKTRLSDILQVSISIKGNVMYRSQVNTASVSDNSRAVPILSALIDLFSTHSVYYIPDETGEPMAEVGVRLSPELSLTFYGYMLVGILFASVASYLLSLLFTSFLTKTVSKPFEVLDKNLMYLAEGNYDELLNSHLMVKKPLAEIKSIADSTNILLDKMHEVNNILSSQNDLLEKQNIELESQNEELTESRKQIRDAQTQLVQNQNLASVGQLTAAISHEINTPLGTINSNVQLQNMILDMLLINPEVTGDPVLYEMVDDMRKAGSISVSSCEQVTLIIKSLKNFSRLDQADFQECDINDSARSVVLLTRYLWKNRIQMHEDYGSLPYVKCYPGLLNQVFMNLVVNAIHSIQQEGHVTIKTWFDDQYVYTSIKDTGVGIRQEKLVDIFDSTMNLSDAEKGIGLGLPICKNIIDKHHGHIEVKSKFGEGTEFTFRLPIHVTVS